MSCAFCKVNSVSSYGGCPVYTILVDRIIGIYKWNILCKMKNKWARFKRLTHFDRVDIWSKT